MPGWFVDVSGVAQRIDGDDSQYADEDGPGLSRDSLVDQPFSSDFTLASLVIRKDSGPIRFRSTTGASWQDVDENFDASTDVQIRQLGQRSEARAVSNETRLWRPMADGYSWLVGFSLIDHRYEVDRDITRGGPAIRPLGCRESRFAKPPFTAKRVSSCSPRSKPALAPVTPFRPCRVPANI